MMGSGDHHVLPVAVDPADKDLDSAHSLCAVEILIVEFYSAFMLANSFATSFSWPCTLL